MSLAEVHVASWHRISDARADDISYVATMGLPVSATTMDRGSWLLPVTRVVGPVNVEQSGSVHAIERNATSPESRR